MAWIGLGVLLLAACDSSKQGFIDSCKFEANRQLIAPATAAYGSVLQSVSPQPQSMLARADRDGYLRIGETFQAWFATVDSQNGFGANRRSWVICSQEGTNPVLVAVSSDLSIMDIYAR